MKLCAYLELLKVGKRVSFGRMEILLIDNSARVHKQVSSLEYFD